VSEILGEQKPKRPRRSNPSRAFFRYETTLRHPREIDEQASC
jgi:hypothetical protein